MITYEPKGSPKHKKATRMAKKHYKNVHKLHAVYLRYENGSSFISGFEFEDKFLNTHSVGARESEIRFLKSL